MTIASQTSRISYNGDGSTTAFSVPFFFSANSDIAVTTQVTATGVISARALGTDYTLTGATVPAGGTCTFLVAPPAGTLVTILRDPPITQTASYNNNDPFPAKSHEGALDKATTIDQRTRDIANRSIRAADGDATLNMVLPVAAVRASQALGFDANGKPALFNPASAVTSGTNVTFLQSGTGAVSRTHQDKAREIINVKDFGAAGDGVTDDTIAINNAITAATTGSGVVSLGGSSAVNLITGTIFFRPGVRLIGPGTIKQKAGSNVVTLIDFSTNSAHGAAITGLTIDGNRANNTDNLNAFTVSIGTANDVLFENNIVSNSSGYAVYVNDGLRPTIRGNTISNFYVAGVSLIPTAGQTPTTALVVRNRFTLIGQHAIYARWADSSIFRDNIITGVQAIGVVNTSGSTVTYVSGTNFANLTPGHFITIAGSEYLITVASSTSLTTLTAIGTNSGVAYIGGPGDLISLGNVSHTETCGNQLSSGATLGIALSNFLGTESCQKNSIHDNNIRDSGQAGIGLQTTSNGTQLFDNQIMNNRITDCGRGATANDSRINYGIALVDFAPATLLNTQIVGNYIRDDVGSLMAYGISLSSVAGGQVFASANACVGVTNGSNINGGITAIALSAGWGTGAAATLTQCQVGSFFFRITAGSASVGANPTITVTTAVTGVNTLVTSKMIVIATGAIQPVNDVSTNSLTTKTFSFIGTPTISAVYDFYVVGG